MKSNGFVGLGDVQTSGPCKVDACELGRISAFAFFAFRTFEHRFGATNFATLIARFPGIFRLKCMKFKDSLNDTD
jgi:hypothetical protein